MRGIVPLLVCRGDDPKWMIAGAVIALVAAGVGIAGAIAARPRSAPVRLLLSLAAGGALVALLWPDLLPGVEMVWPRCGATPDGNDYVVIAILASPLLILTAFLLTAWRRRKGRA